MLRIDLHLHTIASRHAQNTILEYIGQAKKLRMDMIGTSDHGPSTDSLASEVYFATLSRLPKTINCIRVLRGIEANYVNRSGEIDIPDKIINSLDYVMAGLHSGTPYKDLGKKINTQTVINSFKLGKINILTHPFWTRLFDLDMERICEEACKNNVLLEINVHYVSKYQKFDFVIPNLKIIINTVKKYKKKVIIGSDSHNIWELADDSPLKLIKNKIGLTNNLIINNYPKELFRLLKINE